MNRNSNCFVFFSHFQQIHGFEIELELEKLDNRYKSVVSTVKEEDLKTIFMSKPLTQYLFPKDNVVISWMSFKPTLSNVQLLFWHDNVLFSDLGDNCKMDANENGKGLLTSSSYFPVSNSQWVCNIDIFGNDMLNLECHFLAHLNNLGNRACSGDKICVYFCSEDGLPVAKCIKDLLKRNGVTLLNPSKQTSILRQLHVVDWNILTGDEMIENPPQTKS